jgi:hypothetical protein
MDSLRDKHPGRYFSAQELVHHANTRLSATVHGCKNKIEVYMYWFILTIHKDQKAAIASVKKFADHEKLEVAELLERNYITLEFEGEVVDAALIDDRIRFHLIKTGHIPMGYSLLRAEQPVIPWRDHLRGRTFGTELIALIEECIDVDSPQSIQNTYVRLLAEKYKTTFTEICREADVRERLFTALTREKARRMA